MSAPRVHLAIFRRPQYPTYPALRLSPLMADGVVGRANDTDEEEDAPIGCGTASGHVADASSDESIISFRAEDSAGASDAEADRREVFAPLSSYMHEAPRGVGVSVSIGVPTLRKQTLSALRVSFSERVPEGGHPEG